ncbi:MAG: InlB B-repeat-containing protein, partial [Paludibacteraceae bacterium]|nr:InlB B-repeat-containing protein [Paludibacteraceae bacterium]
MYFNLTQMLLGCSKRNGMTVSASNPDGEPTVNRQSRLMSLSGKKAEKEQLSPTCLLSASVPPPFRSRYLRYAAMIFCVLAMSVANIGMAWGTSVVALDPGTYSLASATATGSSKQFGMCNNIYYGRNGSGVTVSSGLNAKGILVAFKISSASKVTFSLRNTNTSNTRTDAWDIKPLTEDEFAGIVAQYDARGTATTYYSCAASAVSSISGEIAKSSTGTTSESATLSAGCYGFYQATHSGDGNYITGVTITASAAPRTFKSGQIIYFKDYKSNMSTLGGTTHWKNGSGNVYAKFYDASAKTWTYCSSYADLVYGSWNGDNAIYKITVPGSGKEYTKVIFTRGTSNTDGNTWNKTVEQTPEIGKNMFIIADSKSSDDWTGSWSKYAPTQALIGDFNDWDPDKGKFVDGRVILDLEADTDYEFKVLVGDGTDANNYWSCSLCSKATNTIDPWQQLYSNQNNWSMRSAEAGEYCFHWNNDTHHLGIYYPQARLKAGEYIYFDSRDNSTWKAADFTARYYFKYYDSGSDQSNKDCTKANATDTWVYNTTVPNNDYIGSVQMNRMVSGSQKGVADLIYAKDRTSSKQNCIHIASGSTATNWTTYCPPMSSATLSDNSTVKISWQTGDGTSGNPYLVDASGTIKVSASATKAVPDDNMTPNYDFKVSDNGGAASSAQSGTGTTYDKGSLSNNHTYEISLDAWNSYNETNGTKNTSATHIWYKALTTYSVTHTLSGVTKSTGREGSGAAAYYQPYTATYAISTGYTMPATITVKFGSSTKTAGTDYTWNSSTGELNIPSGKIDGNVTIIIDGVAKTTAITLDKNNSDPGSTNGSVTATYGSSSLTSLVHATRTGYTQDGYETSGKVLIIKPDGTLNTSKDGYTSGSNWINESSSLTLYARWTANKFNVTHTLSHVTRSSGGEAGSNKATYGTEYSVVFAADGGYTLPAAVSVTVGESDVTANCTWNQSTGTLTIPAAYVTGNIVITVTGEAAVTYTVTYEYNGADGGLRPASATGSSVSLPNPTKEGYTLQGWYTSSGSLAGAATATYNPTSNITLYALWREDACAGGGGGSSTITIGDFETNKHDKSNGKPDDFAKYQYGYINPSAKTSANAVTITTSSGNSCYQNSGADFLIYYGNSIRIYANNTTTGGTPASFEDVTSVSLKIKNANSSSFSSFSIKVGETTVANAVALSAEYNSYKVYTVSGLSNLDGRITIINHGTGGTGKNFYIDDIAITTAGGGGECYYVTYNGNGADGGFTKDEASHPRGSNVTVKTNSFTKTGYTFTGWNTDPDGEDGTAYAEGETISSIAGNMTLYAQWIESGSTYDITYHCNGATSGCPDNATGQVALPDPLATPTKTNYSFGGWYTDEGLSDAAVAGATLDDDADLYAKWTQTITLKTGAQGSGADKTPTVVWQGTALNGFSSAHTATGYTLQGYYTAGSGGVKVLNADGTFAAANVTDYITSSKWSRTGAAPTLFAQWVATEDCRTLKYVWKVTGNFCDDKSTATSAVSMISENDYFTLSGTGYKQESGKSLNLQNTQNNYFLLTAKTGYQIKSICFYGKVQDSSVDYTTDGSSWSALA